MATSRRIIKTVTNPSTLSWLDDFIALGLARRNGDKNEARVTVIEEKLCMELNLGSTNNV